jgi:amino-acid N-acetyltransferase
MAAFLNKFTLSKLKVNCNLIRYEILLRMNKTVIPSEEIHTSQLKQFMQFLEQNKLPFKDIQLNGNFFLRYYDAEGNTVGSGGLELYGDTGLLRSVAVMESNRGHNIGKQIVDDILQRAAELNLHSVFLLTETAYDFFLKKGFSDVSRDAVPDALKRSSEFSEVCPSSAKCMVYHLR